MRVLKSLLFIISALTFQVSIWAGEPKIVLMTSLEPSENRPPLRSEKWNINKKLERKFEKYLRRHNITLKPQVIHFADQVTLFNALQSKDVKALIWVSHAGYQRSEGLSKASSIIDYKGRDLKGVFQAVGSSIKFLGLVGCEGQGFIDKWKSQGWPYSGHDLQTFSRKRKTDARRGLKLAMKSLSAAIKKDRAAFYEETHKHSNHQVADQTLSLSITRENNSSLEMSAVQVYQRGRLLTVLPASDINQEATLKVISRPGMKSTDLKLVIDSGENSLSQNVNLGLLHFESPYQDHWKLFSTPDGKPFGVGTNIYINKVLLNELTPNI